MIQVKIISTNAEAFTANEGNCFLSRVVKIYLLGKDILINIAKLGIITAP